MAHQTAARFNRKTVVNFWEAPAGMQHIYTASLATLRATSHQIAPTSLFKKSRSFSQTVVMLGGCVVLATAGFATPGAAAPAKPQAKSTPVAAKTATPVKSSGTVKSATTKSAPAKTAATTTAGTDKTPHSRIVAQTSSLVASKTLKPGAAAGADEIKTPEAVVEALPEAPAATRIAEATNTPAAAPKEDQEDKKLEVPVNPDNKTTPETTVVIEPAPGTTVVPPTGEMAPGGTVITPSPATPTPDTGETALVPSEAEGKEIATVRVVGNRVVSGDTILLAATSIRPGAAYSSRQAQLDIRKIRELGFFAGVDQQVVPNLEDPNKVDVVFVVVENRVVTGFRFDNNKEVAAADLQGVLVSKVGSLLNSNNVNEDVKKLQELYSERGFAALVTDVKQDDDGTVVYTIQEGVISKIELTGLKKTKPSIVRSVIRTKPGDPFNEQKIQKDLNNIYDTDFFEDVTYKVSDDPETPGALIVTISLKEKRTGQFSVGVGFDSRSKISGFVGLSESNFKGTGKNVSAQVELGAQRSFNLGVGDRFVGSRNASYQFNIYSNRIFREPRSIERLIGVGETDDETRFTYQEERIGARFNYTHPLDIDRTTNILFGYRNERVKLFLVGDDDESVPVDLPIDSSGGISAFSIGFLRDKRDLRIDPSRGGREMLILEQGVSFLGGSSSFTKADLDLRRYFPIIKSKKRGEQPRLVFASRLVVGQTFGQLPAFEQYFIGGSDTVRGYDADEQFGDNQIYGNVELRFRFQRKFQVVAFADAGSAYGGRFSSSRSLEAMFGVGVGVRLQTPIGPVRLDLAKGRDGGVKTHFGIGSSF